MAASSSSSSSSNLRGQLNIKIEEATNVFKTQGRFATPYVVVYAKNTAIGQTPVQHTEESRLDPKIVNVRWQHHFTQTYDGPSDLPPVITFQMFEKEKDIWKTCMGCVNVPLSDVFGCPRNLLDRWYQLEPQSPKEQDKVSGEIHIVIQYIGPAVDIEALPTSTVGFEETDLTGLKRMHLLARTGDLDSIERILFGKDGTVRAAMVSVKDDNNMTPLHLAALEGHLEVVDFLVRRGADIDAKSNDRSTPLHLAAMRNNIRVVYSLIKSGADVTLKNNSEQTALHYVLRFCDDMRLSFILAIVTLLAEPIGGFQNDNTPGWSFLHSACHNINDRAVKFMVSLLLVNNARTDVTDSARQLCWHYLSKSAATWLSLQHKSANIYNLWASTQPPPRSGEALPPPPPDHAPPPLPTDIGTAPPPPSTQLLDAWGLPIPTVEGDENTVAELVLPKLLQIKSLLAGVQSSAPDGAQALTNALRLIDETAAVLAPQQTDLILSQLLMEKYTSRLVAKLLKADLKISLSDSTLRLEEMKGRAIVVTPLQARHRIYYTLYTDCMVLVAATRVHAHVERKLGTTLTKSFLARTVTKQEHPMFRSTNSIYLDPVKVDEPQVHIVPLKRCATFRIPAGFGYDDALQVVYTPHGQSAVSFTLLMLSHEEYELFSNRVFELSDEISRSVNVRPSKDFFLKPSEIIHQSYLAKKGQLVYRWQRYYVRLTRNAIYYFNSNTDLLPRGIIDISECTLAMDPHHFLLVWDHRARGRKYEFSALSLQDFMGWRKALGV